MASVPPVLSFFPPQQSRMQGRESLRPTPYGQSYFNMPVGQDRVALEAAAAPLSWDSLLPSAQFVSQAMISPSRSPQSAETDSGVADSPPNLRPESISPFNGSVWEGPPEGGQDGHFVSIDDLFDAVLERLDETTPAYINEANKYLLEKLNAQKKLFYNHNQGENAEELFAEQHLNFAALYNVLRQKGEGNVLSRMDAQGVILERLDFEAAYLHLAKTICSLFDPAAAEIAQDQQDA